MKITLALFALLVSMGNLKAAEPSSSIKSSSTEKSATMTSVKGIVYAKHAGAKHAGAKNHFTSLDVYSPANAKNAPVMIYVHGGAWKIGDKQRVDFKPAAFTNQGFLFVSINYRLHPRVTWKQQAGDIATAIAWVKNNISKHGGSPKQISLMGHSSGAHMAALVALDDVYLKAVKLDLNSLKKVVLLDGAGYDIPLQIQRNPTGFFKKTLEGIFSKDKKQQQQASPISHVEKKKGIPPFLILHVADRKNSKAQSDALGKKLGEAGIAAKVVPCQNKNHRTINRDIGKPNDPPTLEVFKFLKAVSKS